MILLVYCVIHLGFGLDYLINCIFTTLKLVKWTKLHVKPAYQIEQMNYFIFDFLSSAGTFFQFLGSDCLVNMIAGTF